MAKRIFSSMSLALIGLTLVTMTTANAGENTQKSVQKASQELTKQPAPAEKQTPSDAKKQHHGDTAKAS